MSGVWRVRPRGFLLHFLPSLPRCECEAVKGRLPAFFSAKSCITPRDPDLDSAT